MSGPILETWIMGEVLKSWRHSGRPAPFYFYRDKDQKEIDLLIKQDGTIYPLEFKKTASPNRHAVRYFGALAKLDAQVGPGGLICLVNQPLPLTPTTWAIPAGII
jgi:predicted AAA+ superfamily ATPase